MQKQLEQMGKELRELMIYQSPPELGALFTEVEGMTRKLGAQQKILVTKEIEKSRLRKQRMTVYQFEIAIGVCISPSRSARYISTVFPLYFN
jgi:hypothetical protein